MHIHTKGKLAESFAALFLLAKGYLPVRRHAHEIAQTDLLLRRGSALVLVEVKYRTTEITAQQALSPPQVRRLGNQARLLSRYYPDHAIRLDLITVFPRWPFIRHVQNIAPLA